MKKIIALSLCLGLLIGKVGVSTGFAAAAAAPATGSAATATSATAVNKVDHLEIVVNPTAKVGEAVDITIKAVDKTGAVVKNYLGTVYITVESDLKATVPYQDGYTFVAADQGSKTFSKGLSFTKEGKLKVSAVDIETENIEGQATVTVGPKSGGATESTGDITIQSPSNGQEVTDSKLTVNGTSKKNSKVQIFLNGKKDGETQSDEAGNFLYTIKALEADQNVVQAKLLDGTDKVVAQSEQVVVKLASANVSFKDIVIKEGKQVAPGTLLNVTVTAEAGLQEVVVTLGGTDQIMSPAKDGSYMGTINAPAKVGDYPVKVKLTNSMGKSMTKEGAMTLTVVEAQPVDLFKNIKTEKGDKKVTFTFELLEDSDKIAKFKFRYGTDASATGSGATGSGSTGSGDTDTGTAALASEVATTPVLDKESITFDKAKISKDGKYTWYVSGLDLASYSFEIYALDKSGKILPDYNKAVVAADLSLSSAGKCSISNIGGLKVTKKGDVSELTWDTVPEATAYKVYKKDKDGKWQLVESVPTNKYIVNIAGNKITYADFAIKGVCGENENESKDFSNITKVQTGPGLFIILALSGILGFFLVRRKVAR